MIGFKYDVSTYKQFFFERHHDTISYLREYVVSYLHISLLCILYLSPAVMPTFTATWPTSLIYSIYGGLLTEDI